MIPYENHTDFEEVKKIVKDCFPDINDAEIVAILREVVFAPDDYEIEYKNQKMKRADMAKTISEHICNNFALADPKAEYDDMLESAAQIIKHTNDGYITDEDASERENFLTRINKREFELYLALGVMSSGYTKEDESLKNELIFRIRRLREMNDLIRKYSRDGKGIEVGRADYERALPIYKMIKSLKGLGYGYNLSRKERISLDIDHDDDEDLSEDFAFSDWIKRLMLLQIRRMEKVNAMTVTNSIRDFCQSDEKIGRTSTILDDMNNKISELRGTIQKRRFDSGRFSMLEEAYETNGRNFF